VPACANVTMDPSAGANEINTCLGNRLGVDSKIVSHIVFRFESMDVPSIKLNIMPKLRMYGHKNSVIKSDIHGFQILSVLLKTTSWR